jgi:hypothetical protein
MEPHVDLQHHVEDAPGRAEDPGQGGGSLDGVDSDREAPQALRQRQEACRLVGPHHRVGDEEVLEAGGREHLGLRGLRHRQPGGAARDLQPADVDHLVGLGMRTQAHAVGAGPLRHARDVALQNVEVDENRRRRELVDGAHAARVSP